MENIAPYFLKMMIPHTCGSHPFLLFRNLMMDNEGHYFWFDDEIKNKTCLIKKTIVGVCDDRYDVPDFLNITDANNPTQRAFYFSYDWNSWGTFSVLLESIRPGPLTKFLDDIFTQALIQCDNGNNVFLGKDLFIKKNSTYEHLVNIDIRCCKDLSK